MKVKHVLILNSIMSSPDEVCAICRDLMDKKTTALACKHTFHSECIDQWLAIVPQCPYCRNFVTVAKDPAKEALEMYYLGQSVNTDYTYWATQQVSTRTWFRTQFRNCELEPSVISELLEDDRVFFKDDIIFGIQHSLFSDDDIEYILEQQYITEEELKEII
jgi:Ring finger domain